VNEFLTWLLDAVQSVDPVLRTVIAGVAIMLETSVLVGLVVPGDTIVIIAGTAVGSPLEAVVLILVVILGALIGESIGFWLGRWLGPRIRFSRLGARIGEHNWTRAELYLRRRGGPAIFLSRFLPVLHSLVPLTVGMSGFAYRRFLAWTAPACALWAILYVSVAAAAAGTYRELADRLHFAGYIFVGIIVLFLSLVYLAKRVIVARESRHLDVAPDSRDGADDVGE
jgi:membrane-associated protein